MKHSTMVITVHHSMTGEVSGHRARCTCGWKSSFSVNRGLVEGSAKAHREVASRKLASR